MMLVPTPWFLIPDYEDVLIDGHPVPVRQVGYPADLSQLTLRCVYTDAEVMNMVVPKLMQMGATPIPSSS